VTKALCLKDNREKKLIIFGQDGFVTAILAVAPVSRRDLRDRDRRGVGGEDRLRAPDGEADRDPP
jgi:hypothetical protein